jgi:hypothetical protein
MVLSTGNSLMLQNLRSIILPHYLLFPNEVIRKLKLSLSQAYSPELERKKERKPQERKKTNKTTLSLQNKRYPCV